VSGKSRRLQEQQRRRSQRQLIAGLAVAGILMVAVMVIAFTAGGSSGPSSDSAASTISMTEMAFAPDPIEVSRGDAKLRIVNDGKLPHSFLIPELGKGTPDLATGDEMELDLTTQEPGTYRVICDVPGHLEQGMETTLILR
jgi:uncharacterized cupredoxin-like copper-binding protein